MLENAQVCCDIGGQRDFFTNLPDRLINEILEKLDLESLCSTACVCRFLRCTVSQLLSSLSSLDLSSFSPDVQTLNRILGRFKGQLNSITLDALRLNNSAVGDFLEDNNVQDLILLKGSLLSHRILYSIRMTCPNLRTLVLELEDRHVNPEIFKDYFIDMLTFSCTRLETLSIKVGGEEDFLTNGSLWSPKLIFPKNVKILKLSSILEAEAIQLLMKVEDTRSKFIETVKLQSLTLVLDVITDHLMFTIVHSLPLLVELDLKDKPYKEPTLPNDLSSTGLQCLNFCQRLSLLSLVRGRKYHPAVSFKSVNDMSMFLLSEGCKQLQSVRFEGFSRVTDAGYACILHSCPNLRKLEIRGAASLSDLAFDDISRASFSLSEVRILSCGFITSRSVKRLASGFLETLNLYGCRSVADDCLSSISDLPSLTTLNLGANDISDSGLAILGAGSSPITRLSLRGSKRITDAGITYLLSGGGRISKTLSSLDIGCIPNITDTTISNIVGYAPNIIELCIRYCFHITDASLRVLGRGNVHGKKLLRRLDIGHCLGLSFEWMEVMRNGGFCGLRWLGVGGTCLNSKKGDDVFDEIVKERPWLTICLNGCEMEMGCWDAWHCPDPLNYYQNDHVL